MLTKEEIAKAGFATRAVHVGAEKNMYGTLATPIYQTSTFIFDNAEQGGRRFSRRRDIYTAAWGTPHAPQWSRRWHRSREQRPA